MTTLALDVGNTRLKAGLAAPQQPLQIRAQPLADWPILINAITAGQTIDAALIASVNPTITELLVDQLRQRRIPVQRIWQSDGAIFQTGLIQHDLETPQTIGVDRVLAAYFAHRQCPRQSVVAVDAGSAVTLTVMNAAGVLLGGAIMPGYRLMQEALATKTASLPAVALTSSPIEFPARSTVKAIEAGVRLAISAAVERGVERAQATTGENTQVFITGGNANTLAGDLPMRHQVVDGMVLRGLLLLEAAFAR